MLPAHRVIGHKEYAAGRKVDPIYAMDWRRGRIATFTPRTRLEEDDMFTDDDRKALDWLVDAVNGAQYRHDDRISLLAANQRHYSDTAGRTVENVDYLRGQVAGPLSEFGGRSLVQGLRWMLAEDGSPLLLAAVKDADPAAVAEALKPMLAEAVAAGMAADNAAQANEIVDRLAARLAGTV